MTAASYGLGGWQQIEGPDTIGLPVVASDIVYEGAMGTLDIAAGVGEIEPAQDAAGHIFAGIFTQTVDNTGDGLYANVDSRPGIKFWADVSTGFTPNASDIGKLAYVADDKTVVTAANSTHKVLAGLVVGQDGTRVKILAMPFNGVQAIATGSSGDLTVLTDSSGFSGSHDDTIAAMAAITTLTDSTGDSGTHDDTVADGLTVGAITAYSAHSSGGTTVTSNAATDLDTTAAALATLVAEVTTMRTDIATQNQNDSDIAQKVIELVARDAVVSQNISDITQKLIEIHNLLLAAGIAK